MSTKDPSFPTQNDVRLNPAQDDESVPHLPKTQGWRQYNPAAQVHEYEFLLGDVLNVGALAGKVDGYDNVAGNFAKLKEFEAMATAMHNVSHEGDRDPVQMRIVSDEKDARHIETYLPEYIRALHQQYSQDGWSRLAGGTEHGGSGTPHVFANATCEMMMTANPGYGVLELLSGGVVKALEAKGSDELKAQWLPRLNSGQFTGAMVMTEPDYGSSLMDMKTTVRLDKDGNTTGKVYGYKRFISSADHDATLGENGERNIVHMVLARTADAEGNLLTDAKGRPKLSLVLVPRVLLDKEGHHVDDNGNQTDTPNTNHVRAAKLNDKMGLEVQSNTDAAYDGAKGFVVGEVGDGLRNMFVIMNEARLGVGLQGVGVAELARQNVERYARERKQGPAGEISNYPDMQDKILNLRSHIEAGRHIAAEVGMYLDKATHSVAGALPDKEKAALQKYVDIMTPLVKWGLTEKCDHATDEAMQAMGGAGYMREWGIAQTRADSRISRIYEGSNPVLAVSEITMYLKDMDTFTNKFKRDIATLEADKGMGNLTAPLNDVMKTFEQATSSLRKLGFKILVNKNDETAKQQFKAAAALMRKASLKILRNKNDGAAKQEFQAAVKLMQNAGFKMVMDKDDEAAKQQFQAAAPHYMELMYAVASGVALAKNAHAAKAKLQTEGLSSEQQQFYQSKVDVADYYCNSVIGLEHEMHLKKMQNAAKHLSLPSDLALPAFPDSKAPLTTLDDVQAQRSQGKSAGNGYSALG